MNRTALINRLKEVYAERNHYAELKSQALEAEFLKTHPELAKYLEEEANKNWDNFMHKFNAARLQRTSAGNIVEPEKSRLDNFYDGEIDVNSSNHPRKNLAPDSYDTYRKIAQNCHYCKFCQDTGIDSEGKICPKCYANTWRQVLYEQAEAFMPQIQHKFANFNESLFSEDTIKLKIGRSTSAKKQIMTNLKIAKSFVEDFPSTGDNLFFSGKPGTGKTFLAECIANALIDEGYFVTLLSNLSLEETINQYRVKQNTFAVKSDEVSAAREKFEMLWDADLLIIDDFGILSGFLSNPLAEVLNILRERKVRNKQTIITTNYDLPELKKVFDERLFSRLFESFRILPFVGADIRFEGRK